MKTGKDYKLTIEYASGVSWTKGESYGTLAEAADMADAYIKTEGREIKRIEIIERDWDNRRGSCATSKTVKAYDLRGGMRMKHFVCVAYGTANTGWREPIHVGPQNWWIQEKFAVSARDVQEACKEIDKYKAERGNPDWTLVKAHQSPDGNRYLWDTVSISKYYNR